MLLDTETTNHIINAEDVCRDMQITSTVGAINGIDLITLNLDIPSAAFACQFEFQIASPNSEIK